VCNSRPTVYTYVPNFVLIGLYCRTLLAKNPFFAVFGLWHLVVSPIGSSLGKLNTSAQLQTFPYQTASKFFLYSNDFMAKSGAQSLTFKSVTNRQTDRQKNSTFLATPAATKLGTVIEDLEHILASPKLFRVRRVVSPLGSAQILGEPDPLNLKPLTQ